MPRTPIPKPTKESITKHRTSNTFLNSKKPPMNLATESKKSNSCMNGCNISGGNKRRKTMKKKRKNRKTSKRY